MNSLSNGTALLLAILVTLSAPERALAAPVTYVFKGGIDSSYSLSTDGSLAGLFAAGDAYTITAQFDDEQAPDNESTVRNTSTRLWDSGVALSLDINGETFTVTDAAFRSDDRRLSATIFGNDVLGLIGADRTTDAVGPGTATSSYDNVEYVEIAITLGTPVGSFLLDKDDLQFPNELDLAEWTNNRVEVIIRDFDPFSQAYFRAQSASIFDSISVGSVESVPSPAAVILLALGFAGMTVARSANGTFNCWLSMRSSL